MPLPAKWTTLLTILSKMVRQLLIPPYSSLYSSSLLPRRLSFSDGGTGTNRTDRGPGAQLAPRVWLISSLQMSRSSIPEDLTTVEAYLDQALGQSSPQEVDCRPVFHGISICRGTFSQSSVMTITFEMNTEITVFERLGN